MGFIIAERLIERGLLLPFLACPGPSAEKDKIGMPGYETTLMLISRICTVCPFSENDCDFTDVHRRGASATQQVSAMPCGCFLFLGRLIESKVIDIKDINQVI